MEEDDKTPELYQELVAKVSPPVETKQNNESVTKTEKARRQRSEIELEQLDADLVGRKNFYHLRMHWSWVTTYCLIGLILAQVVVIGGIGIKKLDYTTHVTTVNLFMGQTFLQVIGIAYIVVRFLFPSAEDKKAQEGKTAPQPSDTTPSVEQKEVKTATTDPVKNESQKNETTKVEKAE